MLNGFDTLFIAGGSGAAHAKHDSRLISRLRAVAAKVHVVRALGEGQALLAEADLSFGRGHLRTASSSPGALRSPGIYGAAVPVDAHSSSIAAALTVIRRDHGTSMAQRILERSTSSAWPGPGLGAMLDDDDDEGTSHKITAAAHWLCANYSQPISVTEAAQVVRMSTRNFLRRFKTQIGLTPSEYLLRARLDASCLLLVETDLPIDGIARRCGVSSGDGLAKIFRKRLSISPTDYRAAHRHGAELRFDDQ